jgi:hypothetical protein
MIFPANLDPSDASNPGGRGSCRAERSHRRRLSSSFALPVLFCAACIGCYDGSALIHQARSAAQSTRLAEIDLGTYHTTMPKDPATKSLTELELHLFGAAPRYHAATIERRLRSEDYRLRHELLAAVRQASAAELSEPDLTRLRARIEMVVNEILKDSPIESIGFYDVRLQYR